MITVTTFYRQEPPKRSWLPKLLGWGLLALLALTCVASCGFIAWRSLYRTAITERALAFSQKKGIDLRISFVDAMTPGEITLQGVHVTPNPRATVSAVLPKTDVSLDLDALQEGESPLNSIRKVKLSQPLIHVTSDGTPKGLLNALKAAMPQSEASEPKRDAPPKQRRIPRIQIEQGRVIDHGGFLQLHSLEFVLERGQYEGSFYLSQPDMGPCQFTGNFEQIELSCERAFDWDLPNDYRFSAGVVEFRRTPIPSVRIPKAHIKTQHTENKSFLSELSADIKVTLERIEGRWPIELKLAFPGGGQIEIAGEADESGFSLSFDVTQLDLSGLSPSMQGNFTGSLSVKADRNERTARIKPRGRLHDLVVEHPALSDQPIGPFELAVKGDIFMAFPQSDWRKLKIDITNGRVELGDIPFEGEFHLDNTGDFAQLQANVLTPRVTGDAVTDAIPKGLLPNLQPLHFEGATQFSAEVAIDMSNLPATKLDASIDLKRFKLQSYNPSIDLMSLRSQFETHFEMPDETVIVREQGPDTDRWVPLDRIPPLFPQAITAQEDGGFYRHKGVSMLHLRGSLIRNLERGSFARGGSTLTMQLARNLFLNRRKTLGRKLEELIVTWLLEQSFSKDELIELYMNVVEFGPGIFGIGDAAEHYFGRAPMDLTPPQIAFLVRLLPSPRAFYDQFEKKKLSKHYKRYIERLLKLCQSRGYLSQDAVFEIDTEHFFDPPADPPIFEEPATVEEPASVE